MDKIKKDKMIQLNECMNPDSRNLTESIKVQTYSGYDSFSKRDIQDLLDDIEANDSQVWQADNPAKWIYQALLSSMPKSQSKKAKKAVERILIDMIGNKIKKVDFSRDQNGIIFGLDNINISKYL